MKRTILTISFLMVIASGYLLYYYNQYDVKNEAGEMEGSLKKWMNRPGTYHLDFEVLEMTSIGESSSSAVMFESENNEIGYFHLIKGWNGRFKVDHAGWGTAVASYSPVETNEGVYGLLVGKNPDMVINEILLESPNKDYRYTEDVAGQSDYMRYHKLPEVPKDSYFADLTFYGEDGEILSSLY